MPSFNPVCASGYTFDKELDIEELRESLHKQCKIFPKYRQRLAIKNKFFQPPYYEDDPDWSLDRHLEVINLPEPAGPKELNAFVGLQSRTFRCTVTSDQQFIRSRPILGSHGMKACHCGRQRTYPITQMVTMPNQRWCREAIIPKQMVKDSFYPLST